MLKEGGSREREITHLKRCGQGLWGWAPEGAWEPLPVPHRNWGEMEAQAKRPFPDPSPPHVPPAREANVSFSCISSYLLSTFSPFINLHTIHQSSFNSSTLIQFISLHTIREPSYHVSTFTQFIDLHTIPRSPAVPPTEGRSRHPLPAILPLPLSSLFVSLAPSQGAQCLASKRF